MNPIYQTTVPTAHGDKTIAVYHADVLDFDEELDILTTSAYVGSYAPTPRSLFGALNTVGISAKKLAKTPAIDLRQLCRVWLSESIYSPSVAIRRIGCIEMSGYYDMREDSILNAIKAYFQMLDVAATGGIRMNTVALPLLGSGDQHLSAKLVMIPIINECLSFLTRNEAVRRICFIERSAEKSHLIADALQSSYLLTQKKAVTRPTASTASALAFISYSSDDKNIANNLCAKLERRGIRVWYAPRDVHGPYADAIVDAIGRATHFIVILSESSMRSEYVLNEIDLAFQNLPDRIKFKPLRIDGTAFSSSVRYYLSRQHWMDAIVPPLEERLNEFVESIAAEL